MNNEVQESIKIENIENIENPADKIEQDFMEFVKKYESDKALQHMQEYNTGVNNNNYNQMLSCYKFFSTVENKDKSILLAVECLEELNNINAKLIYDLIFDMYIEYYTQASEEMIDKGICFNIKNEKIMVKSREDLDYNSVSNSNKSQVFEIRDLKSIVENTKEMQEKMVKYIKALNQNDLIFITGSKENISATFTLLGKTPQFYFTVNEEYSNKEFKKLLRIRARQADCKLEEGWEKYVDAYLLKPSEMNRKKNHAYLVQLFEMLRNKALSDIKQVKEEELILIKNEYFSVSLNTGNFQNIKSLDKLNALIGMQEVKNDVKELIAYLEFNQKLKVSRGKSFPLNLHMMFTGTPGTGKTTIARIVAEILFELGYIKENKVIEVGKKDLVSKWVGDTAIKTNEIIQKARGGVLFIDEAYSLLDDNFGPEAIATLITAMMDLQSELVVIFAGYKEPMEKLINSNAGLYSRIGKKIHFEDYTKEELMQIYEKKMNEYSIGTDEDMKPFLNRIIEEEREVPNFGNGRFIDNFIQNILLQHAIKTQGITDENVLFTVTKEDIPSEYEKHIIKLVS